MATRLKCRRFGISSEAGDHFSGDDGAGHQPVPHRCRLSKRFIFTNSREFVRRAAGHYQQSSYVDFVMNEVKPQVIWNLRAPLTQDALSRQPSPTIVQLSGGATEYDHALLDSFLSAHAETTLVLMGAGEASDLEFLRSYPHVHRIRINLPTLSSFDGLRHLRADLTSLSLGPTAKQRVSLRPIERFQELRSLGLVEQQTDIEVLTALGNVEELFLSGIRLPSLDSFLPLRRLRRLKMMLGSTSNLDALPSIGCLEQLSLFRINGLRSVPTLGRLVDLQSLSLEQLSRLDTLPSLAECSELRRVKLDRVGLADLRSVAEAPHLEELVIFNMRHLSAQMFEPFIGHPALRAATIATGAKSVDGAIRAMLNLPQASVEWAAS